jgi:hypothetical protein
VGDGSDPQRARSQGLIVALQARSLEEARKLYTLVKGAPWAWTSDAAR